MIKFLKDERGDVVLLVYLIMIFCILGVLAFDYSRAHAIHARLQTAADAAALAACMKAEVVPEYIVGADGKVRKVRVANLQNRQQQANLA
ncbi:pilus assembly protein TadG-related protein, partial [Peptococcaceae bacterium]|nr:pilus assembly protein TadG-related protein [Peptococcaceae bacterium]